MACSVCSRIRETQEGKNPYFVREMETGYVVLGDYQLIKGYTVFICKVCAKELHELEPSFREKFLREMSQTAQAVYRAFQPEKLNYELLGSGDALHMHWHLFPRTREDFAFPGPVWALPKEIRCGESTRPSPEELKAMKAALRRELAVILGESSPPAAHL